MSLRFFFFGGGGEQTFDGGDHLLKGGVLVCNKNLGEEDSGTLVLGMAICRQPRKSRRTRGRPPVKRSGEGKGSVKKDVIPGKASASSSGRRSWWRPAQIALGVTATSPYELERLEKRKGMVSPAPFLSQGRGTRTIEPD